MASAILKSISESQLAIQNSKSTWANTQFAAINELKPDYSGKVGERLLAELCKRCGIDHLYVDNDKNSKDGTYDIIILGKKIEVKTARLGVQNGFQHENLHADGCDFHIFVDVKPEEFYLTVLPKFDVKFKHPVLGRKPHLRKGTSDVYKFDWNEPNLAVALEKGVSIRVGSDTSVETIGEFLSKKIDCE